MPVTVRMALDRAGNRALRNIGRAIGATSERAWPPRTTLVIPAKAGIQRLQVSEAKTLDSRLRGNDGKRTRPARCRPTGPPPSRGWRALQRKGPV